MNVRFEDIKQLKPWILLIVLGTVCLVVGASKHIAIGANSLELSSPLSLIIAPTGILLILFGIAEVWRQDKQESAVRLPVHQVTIESVEVQSAGDYPLVRVSGRVKPAIPGIRIWILREFLEKEPGNFHVGAQPALSDKDGQWQQLTYLWRSGTFRIHAVVAKADAEILFRYYRIAFDHARRVYQHQVDAAAVTFPDWPLLDSLPIGCKSDHRIMVV
jgi:hypothetical protein